MRPQELAAAKAAEALEPLAALFNGQPALIFAPGPSLTKLWSPERAIPFPSIVINDAWHIAPTADILYSPDQEWWIRREAAPGFQGARVCAEGSGFRHVIALQISGPKGYDQRLGWLCHGSNGGYSAIHLAAQLGASPIVLVGFDMQKAKGQDHYEGHPHPLRTNDSNYEGWLGNFRELSKLLKARGIEVLNATPGSRLESAKILPTVDLEEICRRPSA